MLSITIKMTPYSHRHNREYGVFYLGHLVMIEIHDPVDPRCEYGLILYDYQRTASEIADILNSYIDGVTSPETLNRLTELTVKYKTEFDVFFDGKDFDVLRKKYIDTCNNVGGIVIDTVINRGN